MAVTEAPSRELAPEPERGRLLDWLKTTDHKKIGILYLISSFAFFAVGGVFALLMRTELARPGTQIFQPHAYNQLFTLHGTLMIFLVIFPLLAGFGNYFVPLQIGALDMAFPRINALSFWLLAGRRAHDPLGLLREGRRGGRRLDGLPAALRAARHRPGPLDRGADHRRNGVDPGRHQLHRDHPADAGAGDDHDADAGLHVEHPGDVAPGDPRGAGAHGRADHALRRPATRHGVLRSDPSGRRDPVAARVLVLRASRGLHADPGRLGHRDGDRLGVLGQADLQLPGRGPVVPADHGALVQRLGAPHVRDRGGRAAVLQRHDRAASRSRPACSSSSGWARSGRGGCGSSRPCSSRSASSRCS